MDLNLSEIREVLERTPSVLSALLTGLSEEWTEADEGPETWTPHQVVAHMLDLETFAWADRARHLLEHGSGRPFERVDRTRFSAAGYSDLPLPDLLSRFERLRRENLTALDAMQIDGSMLSREGVHPDLGVVRLSELVATWCVHDLTHIAQLVRVMAKRLGSAVGPWSAYLSVLSWKMPVDAQGRP